MIACKCDWGQAEFESDTFCTVCGCHPHQDVRCDAACPCGEHHFDPMERVLVNFFDRMHGDKAYRRHNDGVLQAGIAAVFGEVGAILANRGGR